MPHTRKILSLMIFFLLFSSLLSACQNEPTDQAQACNQKSLPVVKMLEPAQASSHMVYVSNGYDLYELNSGNGAPRWCSTISAGKDRDQFSGLTYSRGSVYAYTEAGDLASFNAGSGALLWSNYIEHLTGDNFTPPSIVNATVYGGTKSIYALNTQDGSVRWHYSLPDQAYTNSVLVANNGGVYFSINQREKLPQQIYALDAATGNKRWAFSLPENEAIFGQLAVAEGVVVFPYQEHFPDGGIHSGLDVLNTQNGKLLWQKAIGLAMGGIGGNESSTAAHGLFYLTGVFPDNSVNAVASLYAFDAHTGSVRWSVPENDSALDGSLLVVNNVLYSVNQNGRMDVLNARNAQTGKLLWHAQVQAGILGRLYVINDHLFIGTESLDQDSTYFLYAININTHKEDWYANISGDADKHDYSLVCIGG